MNDEEFEAIAQQIAALMPNKQHISVLENDRSKWQSAWHRWRRDHPTVRPRLSGAKLDNRSLQDIRLQDSVLCDVNFWHSDLYGADLSRSNCHNAKFRNTRLMKVNLLGAKLEMADLNHADCSEAIFTGANLHGASLYFTNCRQADFRDADISGAVLHQANCSDADFRGAKFTDADLSGTILTNANLSGVDLVGTDLQKCVMVGTNLSHANISGARVYGISAWDVNLEGTIQRDLIVTADDESTLVVDSLELAQFMYLILNNDNIRRVIDTVTSKIVLILGRFTDERLAILNQIRDALRQRHYVPVLFDFDKPARRNLTETVSTVAHMAKFIVADLTDPRAIPHELASVVPTLVSVPVKPIILDSQQEYSMFKDFGTYRHVLDVFRYKNDEHLLASLDAEVINPVEMALKKLVVTGA